VHRPVRPRRLALAGDLDEQCLSVHSTRRLSEIAVIPSESKKPSGTQDQDVSKPLQAPPFDPNSPLERALARFGAVLAAKESIEQGAG
jgi:hypothetical protein